MRLASALAVAHRITLQLRRDRRTIGLLIVVPTVVLTLLGWAFRIESGPIPVALVASADAPTTVLRDRFQEALGASGRFEPVVLAEPQARDDLEAGQIKAILFVDPPAAGASGLTMRVLLEGSDPQTNATVLNALGRVVDQLALGTAGRQVSGTPPVTLDVAYRYGGAEFDVLDFFAPTFIALFAFFLVFLLTTVSFLREQAQGTLERLMASPITRSEVVLGYMLGFLIFALLQSLVILLFTIFVLRIHYVGNLLVVFVVEAFLTAGAVNMGIFLSTFARNELQAVQFIPIVIVPQVFLSGIFWAIKDMPWFLKPLAYAMPLTYANDALRNVMIRGFGLLHTTVLLDLGMLVLFAALMVLLGAATMRRQAA
ncbi:MAG: ABC transporter permease [Chloroflexi bacterium]|nr:ABC transporter permease [Chloroflexota bacterium]